MKLSKINYKIVAKYILQSFLLTLVHIFLMGLLMSIVMDENLMRMLLEISIFFGVIIFLFYGLLTVILKYLSLPFKISTSINSMLFYLLISIYIFIIILSPNTDFSEDGLIYLIWFLCFLLTITIEKKLKTYAKFLE